jgi:long-chain fatty acid transport protein
MNAILTLQRFVRAIFVGVLLFHLWAQTAFAGSFQINEYSSSGLGTAYSGGAAYSADPSGLFFNPALIGSVDDIQITFNSAYVMPNATFRNEGSFYTSTGSKIPGGSGGNGGVDTYIPSLFASAPILRNSSIGTVSLGVGVSSPWGLETDYQPGWVGRYEALRSKLRTLDVQPVMAWKLFDRLTIGASLDVQRASARLSQAIDFGSIGFAEVGLPVINSLQAQLPGAFAARGVPRVAIPGLVRQTLAGVQQSFTNAGFFPGGSDGIVEVEGNDLNVGFAVGATFDYLKEGQIPGLNQGRIGASFRSGIRQNLGGKIDFRGVPAVNVSLPAGLPPSAQASLNAEANALRNVFADGSASAALNLPDVYRFSFYQRFLNRFAVMGDLTYTKWSRLKALTIDTGNTLTSSTLVFDYKDTLRPSIGVEFYPMDSLTFRLGFAYDESPIRSASFRTPRIPDGDRLFISAGLRWSPAIWVDFDLGYAHLFLNDPGVDVLDPNTHTSRLMGTFDASVDLVSASVTFRFGGSREQRPIPAPDGKEERK